MLILRHSKLIIASVIIGALISLYFITSLRVEYDLESFFELGDEDTEFYRRYTKEFGADENLLMIAIHQENGIFEMEYLEKLDSFTTACSSLKNIEAVNSITTLYEPVKTPFGYIKRPFLHFRDTLKMRKDQKRIMRDPRIVGWMVSSDSKTTSVLIDVKEKLGEDDKDRIISGVDEFLDRFAFQDAHMGGMINTSVRYMRMVGVETLRAMLYSTLMIILVLRFIYGAWRTVWIPVGTVIIGIILLYGYLGLMGKPIRVLSTLFPTIILVVGMSDIVHIYTKYLDELAKGREKFEALKITIAELRFTNFLTSFTTAIGFLTFSTSSLKPIREFGIDAALGIILTYALTIIFIPALYTQFKLPAVRKQQASKTWKRSMDIVYSLVKNHPGKVVWGFVLLCVLSVVGIGRISKNNFILSQISSKTRIRQDYQFFEQHLSGVRSFEMAVLVMGNSTLDDFTMIKDLEKLEGFLKDQSCIGTIYSPVTYYKTVNKMQNAGREKNYKLPETDSQFQKLVQSGEKSGNNPFSPLISKDRKWGRITARMKDVGRERVEDLYDEINAWVAQNMDTSSVSIRHTGSSFLQDKRHESMTSNMFMNLGIAFVIVGIIVSLLYRSVKMVFISIIPNVIPLVVVGAVLGFTNIELDGSISIIFTIGYVIAVDDTIHFLSKYRFERRKNLPFDEIIYRILHGTGKAIIVSSLILFLGFLILVTSPFRETYYNGLLISITIFFALLADLFLLPALLFLLVKKPGNRSNERSM